jgi:hypothetical protein
VQIGYWEQYHFQSDQDYDIIDDLKEEAGLELYFFEAEEDKVKARNAFNEGKFLQHHQGIEEVDAGPSNRDCYAAGCQHQDQLMRSHRPDLQEGLPHGRS